MRFRSGFVEETHQKASSADLELKIAKTGTDSQATRPEFTGRRTDTKVGISILDGGMGSELITRGVISSDGLWSAKALMDAPSAVQQVHADYIDAGARTIITNSYSCVPSDLGKAELAAEYEAYAAASGRIARQAVEAGGQPVKVAGSLPPLAESYRWDLVPPDAESRAIYKKLACALEPYVDLFVYETMSCARVLLS